MDDERLVHCHTHGSTPPAFVCQHIIQGLRARQPVGFFCANDTDNPTPDAWCAACDRRFADAGGQWDGEAEALLGVQLICGHCYHLARVFHSEGAAEKGADAQG